MKSNRHSLFHEVLLWDERKLSSVSVLDNKEQKNIYFDTGQVISRLWKIGTERKIETSCQIKVYWKNSFTSNLLLLLIYKTVLFDVFTCCRIYFFSITSFRIHFILLSTWWHNYNILTPFPLLIIAASCLYGIHSTNRTFFSMSIRISVANLSAPQATPSVYKPKNITSVLVEPIFQFLTDF